MYYSALLACILILVNHPCSANKVFVDGVGFHSLADAVTSIEDGSRIYLEKGTYKRGAYIRNNDISIIGEPGVIFDGAVADGKAALVLTGNNILVESIECVNIKVSDNNGACIKFEGENLTVRDLYAHDSQSGIMTSRVKGKVVIEFSKFERLGNGNGYSHGLYIKADEFLFRFSSITQTKLQGSGIKSRSKKLLVENSLLASMDGKDSRIIDMANYGELIVRDSVLQQGINSSNSQLIAYGLEKNVLQSYSINRIELTNNLVLFDRKKANVFIKYRLADHFVSKGNIFVGDFYNPVSHITNNHWFLTREHAKIALYPFIPSINERQTTMDRALVIGQAVND